MKKKWILFLGISIPFCMMSFGWLENKQSTDVEEFVSWIDSAIIQLEKAQSAPDEKSRIDFFRKSKSYWKRAEILVEYADPGLSKKINGAPVPGIDPNKVSLTKVEPEGYQVLELCWFDEKRMGGNEANALKMKLKEAQQAIVQFAWNPTEYWCAAREEIVRILSFGVSNFDSPVFGDGIGEIIYSLHGLEAVVKKLPKVEKCKQWPKQMIEAKWWLNKNKWNAFQFVSSGLRPLYQSLGEIRDSGSIFDPRWVHSGARNALTFKNDELFSEQLLDEWFFSKYKEDGPTPGAEKLGEKLFFDNILSINFNLSCADCHQPQSGFADSRKKSMGGAGKEVERNSPSLFNSVWQQEFFYDHRAGSLEEQITHVVFNEKEFNSNYEEIIQRLKQDSFYNKTFKEIFFEENQPINGLTINKAIAQYVRGLRGMNADFDKMMRKEIPVTPEIEKGFNLFMGKALCGTCHFAPVFNGTVPPKYTDNESEVIGVTASAHFQNPTLDADEGRYATLPMSFYKYAFKTPGLRYLTYTAPYMHNGAFETIDQVLEFYNKGGGAGMGLDIPHQTLSAEPLQLNKKELKALKAFLLAMGN